MEIGISPSRGEGRKSMTPGLPRLGKITDDGRPHGSRHRHQTVSNGDGAMTDHPGQCGSPVRHQTVANGERGPANRGT